jgi:thiamine-phosphate pyrophosphorylase
VTEPPTGCGLYAVVEAGDEAGARLAAALGAARLAAVLIAPGPGRQLGADEAGALVRHAREAGVTALVLDDSRMARALGADGVHLAGRDDAEAAYRTAREALGGSRVIGVEAGVSRHTAMVLAEAGADYVGFGAPPHLKDRDKARMRRAEMVAWWAPVFEVPCVAFDVESREEAAELAADGADFVAVTLAAGLAPPAAAEMLAGIVRGLEAGATHGATPEKPS